MFGGSQSQCYVQPIEFISRNGLPKESSVWKRVAKGQVSLTDLGLPADFKQGDEVPASLKPILDYSTKFEKGDRYLSPEQTRQLMGISQERFDGINGTTRKASNIMTDYAAARGFVRADGKVEYVTFLAKQGDLWVPVDVLGDAVCTWHEDRLLFNGFPVSKQPIRDKVKKLNPEWYAAIEAAKDRAEKEHVKDFRTLIDPSIKYVSPSPEFFEGINQLFRAGTNQWVASRVYDVYPGKKESLEDSLARAIEEFQKVA
jgi:phosphoribosylaminoimidazole-succinocarboxamide synthase